MSVLQGEGDLWNFPSFLEGLSLRLSNLIRAVSGVLGFPFLLGGAFIEAFNYN